MSNEPLKEEDEQGRVTDEGGFEMIEQPFAQIAAYSMTMLIKLGGLLLAGHEALFVSPPRDSLVFALSAFMMAGATGLDNLIDRFFGGAKK